jgi:hypothetical protein
MENKFVATLQVKELKEIINESISIAISQASIPKEDESLMRKIDVAKLFSVSLTTITDWMKRGKLPYNRINTQVFFKRSEIMKCMELNEKYKIKKS